jgi:sugar/nucleoside kinase (ribokinase family)
LSHSQRDPSKRTGDLLVLGDLCLDIDVYAINREDQLRRASRINLSEGGSAGNVAFTADRLGLTTGLATPMSNDRIGTMLESLVRNGHERVSLHLIRNPKQVTCAIVSLINTWGARRTYYQKNEASFKLEGLIEIASCYKSLHMSGYALELFDMEDLIKFLHELKTFGVEVSLDLFPRIGVIKRSKPELDQLLEEIDLLFGNLREFKVLTGSNTLKSITQNLTTRKICAIIKLGSKGAIYTSLSEKISSPPKKVKPLSLKGAGDVFIAAFLASHIRGHSIKESLNMANVEAGTHIARALT